MPHFQSSAVFSLYYIYLYFTIISLSLQEARNINILKVYHLNLQTCKCFIATILSFGYNHSIKNPYEITYCSFACIKLKIITCSTSSRMFNIFHFIFCNLIQHFY